MRFTDIINIKYAQAERSLVRNYISPQMKHYRLTHPDAKLRDQASKVVHELHMEKRWQLKGAQEILIYLLEQPTVATNPRVTKLIKEIENDIEQELDKGTETDTEEN